jgi:hypothetical protein
VYVFVSPSSGVNFYAVAAAANLLDTGYRSAVVAREKYLLAHGWDAILSSHKNHFFWKAEDHVKHWIDLAADGHGGFESSCASGGVLDTVDDLLACEGVFSAPPLLPDGTPYRWAEYSLGQLELARLRQERGVPTVKIVNPNWYQGCPKNAGDWDTSYGDVACNDAMDDPGTDVDDCTAAGTPYACCTGVDQGDCNEADHLREIAQRATHVVLELAGKATTSTSIGAGSGSGFSYAELSALLENPPSGSPTTDVAGYYQPAGATELRVPPILCSDPNEVNPDSPAISMLAPTECFDGYDNDGDGVSDAADDDCVNSSDDSESPLSCEIAMSQSSYEDEDSLAITTLRVKNESSSAVPSRMRIDLVLANNDVASLLDLGSEGGFSVPADHDEDLADPDPIELLTVSSEIPRGAYSIRCYFTHPEEDPDEPFYGYIQADDSASFEIE